MPDSADRLRGSALTWVSADIARLSEVIEQLLAPYEEQLQQAESMPGWARRAAQDAIAETGADMSRFRTGAHLVSWAGRAPLDHQSGTRKGRARSEERQPVSGSTSWARPPSPLPHPDPRRGLPLPAAGPPPRQAQPRSPSATPRPKVLHKLPSNLRHAEGKTPARLLRTTGQLSAARSTTTSPTSKAFGFEVTLCRTPDPSPNPAPQTKHTPSDAYIPHPQTRPPPHWSGSGCRAPS